MKAGYRFSIGEFRNGINRTLSDTRNEKINKATLRGYGRSDWESIREALTHWEEEGYLDILKDPETADDFEECVEMKSYIEHSSPIPGFLDYTSSSNQPAQVNPCNPPENPRITWTTRSSGWVPGLIDM